MNDITIAKISLVMAIAGILALFGIATVMEPVRMEIGQIDATDSGKIVRVYATIESISMPEETAFITLNDGTGTITGVIFKSSRINSSIFNKTDVVDTTGRVSVYRGEIEIIIEGMTKR